MASTGILFATIAAGKQREIGQELADPSAEFVIAKCRDKNCNLRTQLLRILKRAGVEPWSKPFQNLRSTRQTELAEQNPAHVAGDS